MTVARGDWVERVGRRKFEGVDLAHQIVVGVGTTVDGAEAGAERDVVHDVPVGFRGGVIGIETGGEEGGAAEGLRLK